MNLRTAILAIASTITIGAVGVTGHADDTKLPDYDITASIPATQINKNNLSAIDLKLAPGQEEHVTFYITNTTKKSIDLQLTGGTATTRDNGIINYVTGSQNVTGQVPYKVGDYITIQNTVTVPAAGETSVAGTIKMPDHAIQGQLVGGVSFVRTTSANTASEIPVILQNDTTPVSADVKIGRAALTQLTSARVIGVKLTNNANQLVNDATVATKVQDNNGKTVFEKTSHRVDMAPKSTFNFEIKDKVKSIKPGKYTVKVQVKTADMTKTATKTLTVTAAQVAELTGSAVAGNDWQQPRNWWKLAVGPIIVFLAVFLLGRYLLPARKRRGGTREDLKRKDN